MKPSEADLQETKTRFINEDIFSFEVSKDHSVLLRRPNEEAVYAVFDAGAARAMPMYRLARSCVVWPSISEWDTLTKKFPVWPMKVAAFALELAAAEEAAEAKKV